jgi:hypothetical protein
LVFGSPPPQSLHQCSHALREHPSIVKKEVSNTLPAERYHLAHLLPKSFSAMNIVSLRWLFSIRAFTPWPPVPAVPLYSYHECAHREIRTRAAQTSCSDPSYTMYDCRTLVGLSVTRRMHGPLYAVQPLFYRMLPREYPSPKLACPEISSGTSNPIGLEGGSCIEAADR